MNNAIITSYSFENFAVYTGSLQMYVQFNLFFTERIKTLIRLDDNVLSPGTSFYDRLCY